MDKTSKQQRAKWVERWKDSGLTARDFAAEVGLKASALYYWSSQLSAAGRVEADNRGEVPELPMRSRGARDANPAPRFSQPSDFVELPIAAVAQTPVMLELMLGGVCVRVPSGFDEVTLTRVVRALGGAR